MSASRAPRQTAVICITAALIAFLLLLAWSQPRAGASLAVGLTLGAANSLWSARALGGAPVLALMTFMRIGALSALALLVGVLIQPTTAWLTLAGIAASQLLMSALAARELLKR